MTLVLSQHTHKYVTAALYFIYILKHRLLANCKGDDILNNKINIEILYLFRMHYYYSPSTAYDTSLW